MELKLNTKKILELMEQNHIRTKSELATKMKIDRQLVFYDFNTQSIKAAVRYAEFFGLDPIEFIA